MRNEWACSTCGDVFTRKSNCERHINGKNIHAGVGNPIPVSVYPYGGKRRRHSRVIHHGESYRNDYYYDNYSRIHAQPVGPLGAGGNYAHGNTPAGPHQRNRPTSLQKMAEKWELLASITENMEKVSKSFSLPAGVVVVMAAAANRGFPTEIIVGRACENCMTVDYVPLPDANTGSYDDVNHDVCKNRGKPVEEGEDSQRRLVNIHEKISPETLRRMVDIWLRGHTKYLVAYRLPLERLSALPASGELKWYEIDAAKLKNNSNAEEEEEEGERMVNEPRPHTNYIARAIRNSDQSPRGSVSDGYASDTTEDVFYGWVPLTEDHVFHFLTKARATAMVCHVVYSRDGNGNGGGGDDGQQENGHWYYLKIVPPHEIAAREQREQNPVIKSMIKEMYTGMMSELKEEEMNDPDGSWENYFSKRQQEQPMAGASNNKKRMPPPQRRQQKSKKQQQQLPEQQEKRDNNNPTWEEEDEDDKLLRMLEPPTGYCSGNGLGNNNNSARQHDAQSRHYAIQDILGGPTEKESWYLGIEIEEGVTRIWGFPGVSADMMKPKSQEQGNGGRGVNHQDDQNKCQVCYGLEYPSRTMSSFLFGLPPLEDAELDMKGNEATQDNNSNPFSFPSDKGWQIIQDNGTCKIESIKPNEIIFTIPKREDYSWKYFGLTKSFAERYRLLLLSNGENNDRSHSTRPATNGKKLWALCRVA